jgi:chromosomal replication initiator protein
MTVEQLWKAVLGDIELHISRPNFLTWLRQSRLVRMDDDGGSVCVGLPNTFAKEWVQGRYHKLILNSLRTLDDSIRSVNYVVSHTSTSNPTNSRSRSKQEEEAGMQEKLLDSAVDSTTNLNPRYVLNSFIVGSSNELAHAAIQAVVADVGTKYNPLFIYGGVGLGKTHLIQAAGNAIKDAYHSKIRVLYVTSERFVYDVVSALRNKRMEDVKRKYRDVDVLIVDDIQFIGGKVATEQEFFNTFNTLYENNKQIIISSDRPPAAMPTLQERLRSRFEGGMIVDVSYPDYEVRLAILKTKVQMQGVKVDDAVLSVIAERVQKNIRELEGVLNKVLFLQQHRGELITTKTLEPIISEVSNVTKNNITATKIIKVVSDFYDVSPRELSNRSRKKEVVVPRQICMYLMRELISLSFPHIGEVLGGRDHTTAIHACTKVSSEMQKNAAFNQKVAQIHEKLQNG